VSAVTGDSVAEVCRRRGISRDTFYQYGRRYEAQGPAGLEPRSRRPTRSPAQIDVDLEVEICRMRKDQPRWGARRIRAELRRSGIDPPAVSTIHQALAPAQGVRPRPIGEVGNVGPQEQSQTPHWEGHLELAVHATSDEVSKVRQALGSLGLPLNVLDDASLLLSELLSNSIKHSGLRPDEQVRVTADWSGSSLRVTVRDRPAQSAAPSLAGSIRPPPGAESGWGLYLVDRLASRWGTLDDNDGGGYWFELAPETG
jgi:anti-sigma regulatory factor (Ser/Thr protein kinase)/transposase-like protein